MFSIIVPIYNTPKKFLSRCIDSLMNQTISAYEIILVDDGSNEECKKILKQYENKKYVTIIYKKIEV